MSYAIDRLITDADFEIADKPVRKVLSECGFGVLTEIDVKASMKKKIGVDMESHRILGVCNPNMAHQANGMEPRAGAMQPCNVILRAVNPVALIAASDNDDLKAVATQVRSTQAGAVAAA